MRKAKRFFAMLMAATMVLVFTACGNTTSQTPSTSGTSSANTSTAEASSSTPVEPVKIIICNGNAEDNPLSVCLRDFAAAFEEATDGRYEIECHYAWSLGDDPTLAEMCRVGTVGGWFGVINQGLVNYIPEFAATALPYLFRTWDEAYDYLNNSEYIQSLNQKLEDEYNIHYVNTSLNGMRDLTANKKILSPADAAGLRIRCMTAPIWQDVMECLGGVGVPIAFSELYVALQTGVVDGQDNGIASVYEYKFYDVQKYLMKTDHGCTLTDFCINADIWRNMTPEDQKLFEDLYEQIGVIKYQEMMEEYYAEGYAAAEAAGMTIVEQDEMDMQAFYDSADKMINEKYIDDPIYAPMINDVRTYFGR